MTVVLTLTFFSMLFWAFFEQAGSSLNNFTDRNVDRVVETATVSADQLIQLIHRKHPIAIRVAQLLLSRLQTDRLTDLIC